MNVTEANLRSLFVSYSALFNKGMREAPSDYMKVAMTVPSASRENHYAWLAAVPAMRDWIGERIVRALSKHSYSVENKTYEATVSVKREAIEDDQYGVYGPTMEMMGANAVAHRDKIIFALLAAGFSTPCYDGQYFFDTDHPVGGQGDEPVTSVSNTGGGAGAPWFLMDCSKPIRPLLFQERRKPELVRMDRPEDPNVFMKGEYLYGVDTRCNAGFGLWQMAFASKQPLDPTNYATARKTMMDFKGDDGLPLGIRPTHLVVGTSLESAARAVLKAAQLASGATNVWFDTAELIVTPYLP